MTKVARSKIRLVEALGDHQEAYFAHMISWFKKKSSKEEFDTAARKFLSANEVKLHNEFLLAILNKAQAPEEDDYYVDKDRPPEIVQLPVKKHHDLTEEEAVSVPKEQVKLRSNSLVDVDRLIATEEIHRFDTENDYLSFMCKVRDLVHWTSQLRLSLTEDPETDSAHLLVAEIETREKQFNHIVASGEQLIRENHYAQDKVKEKIESVLTERRKLHTAWQQSKLSEVVELASVVELGNDKTVFLKPGSPSLIVQLPVKKHHDLTEEEAVSVPMEVDPGFNPMPPQVGQDKNNKNKKLEGAAAGVDTAAPMAFQKGAELKTAKSGGQGAVPNAVEWPPSLKAYVSRCFNKCVTEVDKDQVENILKGKITKAAGGNTVWSRNWDEEPLPDMLSEKITDDAYEDLGKDTGEAVTNAAEEVEEAAAVDDNNDEEQSVLNNDAGEEPSYNTNEANAEQAYNSVEAGGELEEPVKKVEDKEADGMEGADEEQSDSNAGEELADSSADEPIEDAEGMDDADNDRSMVEAEDDGMEKAEHEYDFVSSSINSSTNQLKLRSLNSAASSHSYKKGRIHPFSHSPHDASSTSFGVAKRENEMDENKSESDGQTENVLNFKVNLKRKANYPHYEMSAIEVEIAKRVAERNALFKNVMKDIKKESRILIEENEKRKKIKPKGKTQKTKNVVIVEPRRSSRDRKPAIYADEKDDPDWMPPKAKRKKSVPEMKRKSNHPVEGGKLGRNPPSVEKVIHDPPPVENPGGMSRRPRKEFDYSLKNEDEFIYCNKCKVSKHDGCEDHVAPDQNVYLKDLEVGQSRAGPNSGRGIFYKGKGGDIAEGVIFGPYTGTFYSAEEMKERVESGYGWEVTNSEKTKVIGLVDPGPDPDPQQHWMAMVNCFVNDRHQNLVAFQYRGGIYYRAIRPILCDEEFLVDYGFDYARDLNINMEQRKVYDLKEFWAEKHFSCQCGQGFPDQDGLQKHRDMAAGARGGCAVRRRELNRNDILNGVKPIVCPVCGWGFKHKGLYDRHMTFVHSEDRPFVCEECGKAYKMLYELNLHKKDHLGINQKEKKKREKKFFKCDECGKELSQAHILKQHIQIVHRRILPYECDQCHKRFGWKKGLQDHNNAAHAETPQFPCDECEKSFKHKSNLVAHKKRIHTADKPFSCQVCEAKDTETSFASEEFLVLHMKRVHPVQWSDKQEKENPVVCPLCPKRFKDEFEVKRHRKKQHDNPTY